VDFLSGLPSTKGAEKGTQRENGRNYSIGNRALVKGEEPRRGGSGGRRNIISEIKEVYHGVPDAVSGRKRLTGG